MYAAGLFLKKRCKNVNTQMIKKITVLIYCVFQSVSIHIQVY